jgi:hypothetical protein
MGEHRGRKVDVKSDMAVRKWLAEVGPAADDLVALALVDDSPPGLALSAAVFRIRESRAPLKLSDLAVTGDDLLAVGVPAGKTIGIMLRRLLEVVLEDPAKNDKETLLAIARTAAT